MKELILSIAFLCCSAAFAQSSRVDEKSGFRDLRFGQTLDVKQFKLDSKRNPGGIEQYVRLKENLRLGQATLARIQYITVNGKLAHIRIESAPNTEDAYRLAAVAQESYGKPDNTLDSGTGTVIDSWKGNVVSADVFLYDKRDDHKAHLFLWENVNQEYVSKHLSELNRTGDL